MGLEAPALAAIGRFKSVAPSPDDVMGTSVGVCGDGSVLAVGLPGYAGTGAVLLAMRKDDLWTWEALLDVPPGLQTKRFGQAVALSGSCDVLVVGAPEATVGGIEGAGVVVPYRLDTGVVLGGTPLASKAPGEDDGFGSALALDHAGTLLAVGAPGDDDVGAVVRADAGTVDVFGFDGTTWVLEQTLWDPDVVLGAEFGSSVALDSDGIWLVVGAPEDSSADLVPHGAAFRFIRQASGNGFAFDGELLARPGRAQDHFGRSVSVADDGTVAVGAPRIDPGVVFVYPPGALKGMPISPARSMSGFGAAVSLSAEGDLLVVGAPGESSSAVGVQPAPDGEAIDSGAAFTFVRDDEEWLERTFLKAPLVADGDGFGQALALSADGETLAVGAPFEDAGSGGVGAGAKPSPKRAADSGVVYLY